MRRRAAGALLVSACLLSLAFAGSAGASAGQESIFMDDSRLVYGSEAGVNDTLDRIKALGADRLRISVFWEVVAPDPDKRARPAFDSANPASYPASRWDRYDKLITQAVARGLQVYLNITGPGPLWATGTPGRDDIADTFRPNAVEFGRFVQAVTRRYAGGYVDEQAPADQPGPFDGLFGPSRPGWPTLPRVTMWSIWNEPNQAGWLTPQWTRDEGGWKTASPRIYRELWDEGYAALHATGHGSDVILVAETAPKGLRLKGETRSIRPLVFLRDLYCVGGDYRPLRGSAAERSGCPSSGDGAAFKRAHPGLFAATGYAHHPYGLLGPPDQADAVADNVAMHELPRLGRALDRVFRAYSSRRHLPIFLTEYGYQTDPPDPTIGVSLRAHARWIDQAEYLAYRNPRVRAHTQFLLYDDGPIAEYPLSDPRHWGSWQGGLLFADGRPKPAYESYQLPVWVPRTTRRRGLPFAIWGMLRAADNSRAQSYTVQYRTAGSSRWRTVKAGSTTNPRGFLRVSFFPGSSGRVRLGWRDPATGRVRHSRETTLRVR